MFTHPGVLVTLLALLLALPVGAQDLPPQPDLDLPVGPGNYLPGALAVPIPPPADEDPRDEPPPVFFGEELDGEGSVLAYVIDLSGSMKYRERVEVAKAELSKSIKGLSENFSFNVISYGCGTRQLWTKARRATPPAKSEALAWVAEMKAFGGTATGPATALALSDQTVGTVALLTDGAPNCGCSDVSTQCHRAMIRNANDQGATINVFKIGSQSEWTAGDLREFCRGVASDSGGNFVEIPDGPA